MKRTEIKRNERQLYRLCVFEDDRLILIEPVLVKAWVDESGKEYPVFEDEYEDFSLCDVYDEDDKFFYSLKDAIKKAFEIKDDDLNIEFEKNITFADLEKTFRED